MREIKFRAWDKEEGEFINIRSFGILENGEVWYVQAIDENERDIDPPYFTDRDDLVIMQYTGLKDKNGREIYEGDICSIDHSEPPVLIRYEDTKGRFIFEDKFYETEWKIDDFHLDELKVVGNI
ncbi:YopX family protein [Ureibacillus sinduriensis]|uniref:YopX family protein n=1 Tax=Ureibacillus sinduriensis TaxID=561440 RepID=UPI00056BF416|nr:YopX family protein [Ureibacillus sinduriensis]